MSIAAINAVTEYLSDPDCELQPRARLTLMLLANHAGKDWTCHPSMRRLAKMTGASLASIKRDLAHLKRQNLIASEDRFNPVTGARTPSLITLTLSQGAAHSCDPAPVQSYDPTPAHSCDLTSKPINEPTIEPSVEPGVDRPEAAGYSNLKAAFNGSTEAMISDVQRFMGPLGGRDNAIKWLTGTLTRYGQDRTVEAWTIVTAAAGKGQAVASPLPFWAKTAGSLKEAPKAADRSKMRFIPSRYGSGQWVPKEAVQ